MADMTVAELRGYLKTESDMDTVLAGYQAAAEAYLLGAGCAKDYSKPLYKTLVTVFCAQIVENPTLLGQAGKPEGLGITFNALVAQLRLSQ